MQYRAWIPGVRYNKVLCTDPNGPGYYYQRTPSVFYVRSFETEDELRDWCLDNHFDGFVTIEHYRAIESVNGVF